MTNNIASLWPEMISQKVLSPRVVLKAQAEALASQTGGILLGEINRRELEGGRIRLVFNIVVPTLGGYRHGLFRVAHREDFPYPAMVDAENFPQVDRRYFQDFLKTGEMTSMGSNRADSEEQFVKLIEKVLSSTSVLSATQSLIARALEALEATEEQTAPDAVVSG